MNTLQILSKMFLGNSPIWYKSTIIVFLVLNPILLLSLNSMGLNGSFIVGWLFLLEFIFTLALALKCYPLQPGGLLAIEAIALGLTSTESVYHEISNNLEVILLLIFMVAGIYFMKNLMLTIFTKLLLNIKSKSTLSFTFLFSAAFLSAFLDALTVTAVLISVAIGFYRIFHTVKSNKAFTDTSHDFNSDDDLSLEGKAELEDFKGFLRDLIMHGAVGTALGGVCTIVGEPQNLLIAGVVGWDFIEFFLRMAPITIPVLLAGLITTVVLETTGIFGFGQKLPEVARTIIEHYTEEEDLKRTDKEKWGIKVQAVSAILLIIGLAMHIAPVGFIGLALIVVQTAFMGITEEHQLGRAFEEALPFTGLLVVFFVIVAMIHDQHLFKPIIDWALTLDPSQQPSMFYLANGILSMISDNVFVATVYIGEIKTAYDAGAIGLEQFEKLAIAINTGTNLPSVATPNGQAAFLFLLTSSLAPLINLDYIKMVKMAFPYTIVLGITGLLGIIYFL